MANVCGNAKNLGVPNCYEKVLYPVKFGFEQRNANDGTANGIDVTTDILDDTYFNNWINEDEDKRLFMTASVTNVLDERGDPFTDPVNGIEYFSSEANRVVTFEIREGASEKVANAINGFRSRDTWVYGFTVDSQISGNGRDADKLVGFRIEPNTIYAKFVPDQKEVNEKIMVTMTLATTEKDVDRAFIPYTPSETGAGKLVVDPLVYDGLIDVNIGAATSITTTSFMVKISNDFGPQGSKQPFTGGLVADFTLEEITPVPAPIVITSVTEQIGTPGTYDFVLPAETSADILRLTGDKDKFDFNNTIDLTIP